MKSPLLPRPPLKRKISFDSVVSDYSAAAANSLDTGVKDKTFGFKNKNKSKNVQKYVQSLKLLPYHVVADYEAEEDDKILDSATTGQSLSRSQQWDNNIAAKVAEFTATFEKQVLAFNIISRKRGLGEFRTEEKLMMEQFLLQEEKRSLFELRAEMDSRQKASRETHEANRRMAAMAHVDQARVESRAHADMMARAPIRGSALGSRGNSAIGSDMGEQEQDFHQDDIMNGWGSNVQREDREPSEDFLNDDETENGDNALQSEWPEGGELDLNAR